MPPVAREVSGGDVLGPILDGVWGCFWVTGSVFGHRGAPGVSAGGWFGLGSASRGDSTPCTCSNTPFGAARPHGWSLCHFLPLLCEICFLRASRGGAGWGSSTVPHTPTPLQWGTRPDVPVTPTLLSLPCLPCPGQAAVPEAGHGAPMGFPGLHLGSSWCKPWDKSPTGGRMGWGPGGDVHGAGGGSQVRWRSQQHPEVVLCSRPRICSVEVGFGILSLAFGILSLGFGISSLAFRIATARGAPGAPWHRAQRCSPREGGKGLRAGVLVFWGGPGAEQGAGSTVWGATIWMLA